MPRRSRACAECRSRRIGCDGASPSCYQCVVTKRSCSGPIQGVIILDETLKTSKRLSRRPAATRCEQTVADPHQPSCRAFMSTAFVSHFVSFFTSTDNGPPRRTWLHAMCDTGQGSSRALLALALEATATAFCGVMEKNFTLVADASKLHGTVLSQYKSLHNDGSPATTRLCISVILSLLEAIWPTSQDGYYVHLQACWIMLTTSNLSEGENLFILKQITTHIAYQTVRNISAAFSCNLLTRYQLLVIGTAPSHFQNAIISNQNFWGALFGIQREHQRPVADRLLVDMFRLLQLLGQNQAMGSDSWQVVQHISSNIEALSAEHELRRLTSSDSNMSASSNKQYFESFTAMTAAYVSAARILLSVAQSLLSGCDCGISTEYSRDILNSSHFLQSQDIGCAYVRMFLPITVVALYSPSNEQRSMARDILTISCYQASFSGLSSLSLERINKEYKETNVRDAPQRTLTSLEIPPDSSQGRFFIL